VSRSARVETIRLRLSNVHLVRGERPVLVDAGAPGDADAIEAALRVRGVDPASVALLILTHAHGDHAGGAGALRRRHGIPIALGRAELPRAAAGRNGPLRTTGLEARLIRPLVDLVFGPFQPDVVVEDELDLAPWGVRGRARVAPAHTDGSLVLELGTDAIAGDLVRGGWIGGRLAPTRPKPHYFMDHADRTVGELRALVAAGAVRLHVGHGGALEASDALKRLAE
jgi:hydroxyacylglutathione hydrolase